MENEPTSQSSVGGTGPTGIPGADKKMVAGLLGATSILWGGFGVHKFYLGYKKEGIIQLILTLCCGIGSIIAVIEGIIYLTKTDEEFVDTYVNGHKGWF